MINRFASSLTLTVLNAVAPLVSKFRIPVTSYCLVTTSCWQTKGDLERIINQPLECGQGTNHEDTCWKTIPQTAETDIAVDPRNGLPSTFAGLAVAVEFRNHYI